MSPIAHPSSFPDSKPQPSPRHLSDVPPKRARPHRSTFHSPDPARSVYGDAYAHTCSTLMSAHAASLLEQGRISKDMARQLSLPWHSGGVLEMRYDEAYLVGFAGRAPVMDPVVGGSKKKMGGDDGDGEWERWLERGSEVGDDDDDEENEGEVIKDGKEFDDETDVDDRMAFMNDGAEIDDHLPNFVDPEVAQSSELSDISSDALSAMGRDEYDDTDVKAVQVTNRRKREAASRERVAKRMKTTIGSSLPIGGQVLEPLNSFAQIPSAQTATDATEAAITPQTKKTKTTNTGDAGRPIRDKPPLKEKVTHGTSGDDNEHAEQKALSKRKSTTATAGASDTLGAANKFPKKKTSSKKEPSAPKSTPINSSSTTSYHSSNYFALLALCRARNLPGGGKEGDLRKRLAEDDENVRLGRERKLNSARKGGRRKGWKHDGEGMLIGEVVGRRSKGEGKEDCRGENVEDAGDAGEGAGRSVKTRVTEGKRKRG
ncbi:hypothetical protein DE146DRAFT_637288 [Phaeosphaeria sp. MPI-PUGE-AT-0046c]|nr:hypothetical protein DE146DRAFT_637288 [Phaeosphaeria sp. MPI-PUGE-AT-0046c]